MALLSEVGGGEGRGEEVFLWFRMTELGLR